MANKIGVHSSMPGVHVCDTVGVEPFATISQTRYST